MAKNGKEELEFTLEEIIAEVRGEKPPVSAEDAAEKVADMPMAAAPQEDAEPELYTEPESVPESMDEPDVRPYIPNEEPELEKPAKERRASVLLLRLTELLRSRPAKGGDAAEEPLPAEEPEEEDPEEDEYIPPRRKKRPRPPYDFISRPFEDAEAAYAYMDKKCASVSVRLLCMLPLLLISIYMTVCLPLGLPMPFGFTYVNYPFYYILTFAVLQAVGIFLAGDVTAAGLMRLVLLHPTMDSVVLVSALCALIHCITIVVKPEWGGYLPYTCVSLLTLTAATLGKRQKAETLKRTCKTIKLSTAPMAIKQVEDRDVAVKSARGAFPDVRHVALRDGAERFSEYYAPIVLVLTAALSVVSAFAAGNGRYFFWVAAAMFSAAAPLPLILAYSFPARRLARRISLSGGALISWSGVKKTASVSGAVLRDADLFPYGSVSILSMKIVNEKELDSVFMYAVSVLKNIGGGLYKAFLDFAREHYVEEQSADEVKFFSGGGISAKVCGHAVMLGSRDFMLRMGVRATEGEKVKNGLYIAIDSSFAGVFSIKYKVQPQAYEAMRLLAGERIRPVLALRDGNLTRNYIESRFDMRYASTEYPELSERIDMSEPEYGEEEAGLAFLARDGILPFAETVAASKKLRRTARFGMVIGTLCAAVGLLLMYFLTYGVEAASASPYNVLLYLLLWGIPFILGGRIMTRL